MNVEIQSVKFDADKKLVEFVEKKMTKLDKFAEKAVAVDLCDYHTIPINEGGHPAGCFFVQPLAGMWLWPVVISTAPQSKQGDADDQ